MPDVAHAPYAAITPSGWRAHMKRSPLGVEVVMAPDDTKGLAKAYEMRFSFPDHLPCVDITWRVEDKTPDPNPDGDGTVLRVWEQAGKGGDITVTLPQGMKAKTAQPVNLRGEPLGKPIAVTNGRFTFALGAWAPKSFVLPPSP